MALGKPLQRLQRVGDFQEVGMGIKGGIVRGDVLDHKVVDSTAIQVGDVSRTVIALSLQGKEKRFLWET